MNAAWNPLNYSSNRSFAERSAASMDGAGRLAFRVAGAGGRPSDVAAAFPEAFTRSDNMAMASSLSVFPIPLPDGARRLPNKTSKAVPARACASVTALVQAIPFRDRSEPAMCELRRKGAPTAPSLPFLLIFPFLFYGRPPPLPGRY